MPDGTVSPCTQEEAGPSPGARVKVDRLQRVGADGAVVLDAEFLLDALALRSGVDGESSRAESEVAQRRLSADKGQGHRLPLLHPSGTAKSGCRIRHEGGLCKVVGGRRCDFSNLILLQAVHPQASFSRSSEESLGPAVEDI